MPRKKPNAKLGRPPDPNSAKQVINLRVTVEQKASYRDAGKADGKEMATWMKCELDKAVAKQRRK